MDIGPDLVKCADGRNRVGMCAVKSSWAGEEVVERDGRAVHAKLVVVGHVEASQFPANLVGAGLLEEGRREGLERGHLFLDLSKSPPNNRTDDLIPGPTFPAPNPTIAPGCQATKPFHFQVQSRLG